MKKIVAIALLACVCSCNADTGKTMGEAKDDVRAQLRDPGSAEFTDVVRYAPHDDKGAVVCGMVNAKNGFGGMTGPRRFVSGAKTLIEQGGDDPIANEVFDGVWQSLCGGAS
jgi:hypothetical protein